MKEKFFTLINRAFSLMIENKLRKDIDDTLLEKLLTVIEHGRIAGDQESYIQFKITGDSSVEAIDFLEQLVCKTEALNLIEKSLHSLGVQKEKLAERTQVFALRLLGLIFGEKQFFEANKNSVLLNLVSNICHCNVSNSYSPSIQDAILAFLSCIAKHGDGVVWLVEQNLTDFAFLSFISSSYYVRKSAATFFATLLSLWTSPKFSTLQEPQKCILKDYIVMIISQLISGVQHCNNIQQLTYCESSVLTLKLCMEKENLKTHLCNEFQLAEKISKCFKNLSEENEIYEKLIDLLSQLSCEPGVDAVIKDMIKLMIHQRHIISAISLNSSFLRISGEKPLSKHQIAFLLKPFDILSSVDLSSHEIVFQVETVHHILIQEMEGKANCKVIVRSSLNALSKLIGCMDYQALNTVIPSISIMKLPIEQQHQWHHALLEDRCVQLSFLELISSILSADVFQRLKMEDIVMLFECLLYFLEQPTSNSNFLSQVLNHFKRMLILNFEYNILLPVELKERLAELLCRRLLSNQESVVDSAIHLVGQMVCGTGCSSWHEILSKMNIHKIVWDIAVEGNHDGPIKSSALHTIMDACQQAWCWEDIKSTKGITEVDIVNMLCGFTHDPDFFVQREALSCLFHWMKSKWNLLPSTCSENLFFSLTNAVKSLDLELKLIALNAWKWLRENSFNFPVISSSSDVKDYLKFLSDSGFGTSLHFALQDYDEAVQYKAANILLDLRKQLHNLGLTKDFISSEDVIENEETVTNQTFEITSRAEKDAGIDIVMNLSTAEQISNILRTHDFCELPNFKHSNISIVEPANIKCTVISLWMCVWSEKIDSILFPNKSLGVYSNYSISLLEDIIAAEEPDISHPVDDTPDCY